MGSGETRQFTGVHMNQVTIADAMAAESGLKMEEFRNNSSPNHPFSIVAKDFDKSRDLRGFTKSHVLEPVRQVWVGGDLARNFDQQATHLAMVQDVSRPTRFGAAALLRFEPQYMDAHPPAEPNQVAMTVLAYGADANLGKQRIDSRFLQPLADSIVRITRDCTAKLDNLVGTRAQPTHVPYVCFDLFRGLQQKLTAGQMDTALQSVYDKLEAIIRAAPKMGTGFGDHMDMLGKEIKAIAQFLPGHPLTAALQNWKMLQSVGTPPMGVTDSSEYEEVQQKAKVLQTILIAVLTGVDDSGDCFSPATMATTPTPKSKETPEGNLLITLENGSVFPAGSAEFSIRHGLLPNVRFSGFSQGSGAVSVLSAELIKKMDGNPWVREQLKRA
jgi:hypothetical protein